jgi:hypothetical protein
LQSRLLRTASALPDGRPDPGGLDDVSRLLNSLSDALAQPSDVARLKDAEIPVKVSDSLSDVARLGQSLVSDLKRASPLAAPRVARSLQQLRLRPQFARRFPLR